MDVFLPLSLREFSDHKVVATSGWELKMSSRLYCNHSLDAARYTVCDLEPKVHRRYIDSQAPPWGVLCVPSSLSEEGR
jgi:hypothetical protein